MHWDTRNNKQIQVYENFIRTWQNCRSIFRIHHFAHVDDVLGGRGPSLHHDRQSFLVVVFVGLDGEQGLGDEVVRGLPGDLAGCVSRVDRALGPEGGAEAGLVLE
jgi:hypothetical protein